MVKLVIGTVIIHLFTWEARNIVGKNLFTEPWVAIQLQKNATENITKNASSMASEIQAFYGSRLIDFLVVLHEPNAAPFLLSNATYFR